MKNYLNVSRDKFYILDKKGKQVLVDPVITAELLIAHSNLEHLRVYLSVGVFYLYDNDSGIYVQLNHDQLIHKTGQILFLLDDYRVRKHSYLKLVVNNLLVGSRVFEGNPQFDRGLLVFENGVLDLYKQNFHNYSAEYFCVSKLSFPYIPGALCPNFMNFILSFSNGQEDRVQFLRAWLNALIFQRLHYQIFLVIIGPAATGKSTFALIATALIGKQGTITTSLKSLHKDNFENMNIVGKKLILISDSEQYSGDLQVLKQLVGGDALQGRIKYIQGAFDIVPEGNVLIVTNHPITSRDTSQALIRRMRTFKADKVTLERISLLYYENGLWKGPLSEELPGIFNYVYAMKENEVYKYIVNMYDYVKSLSTFQKEQAEIINPLLQWIREEVVAGQGAYVGYKVEQGSKALIEDSRRQTIYPAYNSWCIRQGIMPLSHRKFSYELLQCLTSEGYACDKEKRKYGVFITGITLKSIVYHRDYLHGAPVISLSSTTTSTSTSTSTSISINSEPLPPIECSYVPPNKNSVHPSLSTTLYNDYQQLLGPNDMKLKLNKLFKSIDLNILFEHARSLADKYTHDNKMKSEQYYLKIRERIIQNLTVLHKNGVIPFEYKPLGVSPRILPSGYSQTINNVKRIVREFAYRTLAEEARVNNMDIKIVDLDIKSCYTSILLGLYPQHLSRLQDAIQSTGLWEYIRLEFEKKGRAGIYSKPAVKICTYSSFFLGGPNAMITGIMEDLRKGLGLLPHDFRASEEYNKLHQLAREVATEMNDSEIVADFRTVSSRVMDEYNNDYLIGPTGHSYLVNNVTFKSSYPNYLQSFEFGLIAQSTLNTFVKYPDMLLIGHYHDGNVLVVPSDKLEEVLQSFQIEMKGLGQNLGLRYPQSFEVKAIY